MKELIGEKHLQEKELGARGGVWKGRKRIA